MKKQGDVKPVPFGAPERVRLAETADDYANRLRAVGARGRVPVVAGVARGHPGGQEGVPDGG